MGAVILSAGAEGPRSDDLDRFVGRPDPRALDVRLEILRSADEVIALGLGGRGCAERQIWRSQIDTLMVPSPCSQESLLVDLAFAGRWAVDAHMAQDHTEIGRRLRPGKGCHVN